MNPYIPRALGAAAKGATTGAAIGSAIPGVGTGVAGGIGALVGAGSSLVGGALGGKAGRIERKQTFADVAAMRAGQLGLSSAEKRQALAGATQAAGQQIGAAQRDVAREALAGNGAGAPGQYVRAQQALGSAGANAVAGAALAVDEASRQQAEARRQQIMAQLQRQQQLEAAQSALTVEEAKSATADIGFLTNMFFHYQPEGGKDLYNGKAGAPLTQYTEQTLMPRQ